MAISLSKGKRDAKRTSTKPARQRPLWRCPECGERFVTKNLWHSCGKHTLEELFSRSEPHVSRSSRNSRKRFALVGQ